MSRHSVNAIQVHLQSITTNQIVKPVISLVYSANEQRPQGEILSEFNYLFLKFHSGAEEAGTGFIADYEQRRRDKAPEIPYVPGKSQLTCPTFVIKLF